MQKLTKSIDPETFRQFYWDKKQLLIFCSENNLPTIGSKDDLKELADQNATLLFHELERITNCRQDHCVWDVFAAIIHEAATDEASNWWEWTAKRKALQLESSLKREENAQS